MRDWYANLPWKAFALYINSAVVSDKIVGSFRIVELCASANHSSCVNSAGSLLRVVKIINEYVPITFVLHLELLSIQLVTTALVHCFNLSKTEEESRQFVKLQYWQGNNNNYLILWSNLAMCNSCDRSLHLLPYLLCVIVCNIPICSDYQHTYTVVVNSLGVKDIQL